MSQSAERKGRLPCPLCQGDGGSLQSTELAVNPRLMPMAHRGRGESLPLCLNDCRSSGPHLLKLRTQRRPCGEDLLPVSFDETWKPAEIPELRR